VGCPATVVVAEAGSVGCDTEAAGAATGADAGVGVADVDGGVGKLFSDAIRGFFLFGGWIGKLIFRGHTLVALQVECMCVLIGYDSLGGMGS